MWDLTEVYSRADVERICSLLLYGTDDYTTDERPVEIRIKEAREKAVFIIRERFPDPKEYDEITEGIDHLSSEIEHIYMQLGFEMGLLIRENATHHLGKNYSGWYDYQKHMTFMRKMKKKQWKGAEEKWREEQNKDD